VNKYFENNIASIIREEMSRILEEHCLYQNDTHSIMFRRNMSPPSSGSKNKSSKKAASKQLAIRTQKVELFKASLSSYYLHVGFFYLLFFGPEGDMFHRNVG
jgi:hypothetical protein